MPTHTIFVHVKENRKDISSLPSDLALRLTLTSSNYPCIEHVFMVPQVFEPLKFYCNCLFHVQCIVYFLKIKNHKQF